MTFGSLQSYNIKACIPNYFMLFFLKTTSVSQIVAFKVVLLKMLPEKYVVQHIFRLIAQSIFLCAIMASF